MDTKEAIEFIEDENVYMNIGFTRLNSGDGKIRLEKYEKKKEEVISLLQQGEAYKQMWKLNMEEATYNSKEGETIHPTRILLDLERLEQKYLKEAKQ